MECPAQPDLHRQSGVAAFFEVVFIESEGVADFVENGDADLLFEVDGVDIAIVVERLSEDAVAEDMEGIAGLSFRFDGAFGERCSGVEAA